jgi:ABC-type antimicrobial peptide transport system permease subunit
MIHKLIIGNLKDDPMRVVKFGLLVAIEACVLEARIGIANALPSTDIQAMTSQLLSNLMEIVFWISFVMAVLVKYVDISERNHEFGLLHILGFSYNYIASVIAQEIVIESFPGALFGLALGYVVNALLEIPFRGQLTVPFYGLLVVATIAMLASMIGAILALSRSIREGVAQAL